MGGGCKREDDTQSAPSGEGRNRPSAELVDSLETVDKASLLATGRHPVALVAARIWEGLCHIIQGLGSWSTRTPFNLGTRNWKSQSVPNIPPPPGLGWVLISLSFKRLLA